MSANHSEIAEGEISQKGISQKGITKLGLLITVVVFGSAIYLALQVANFFYCFYELEGLMEFQGKKAQEFTDAEMRETIFNRIKELDVPIDDPQQIKINRVGQKIIIESSYDEVLFVEFRGKEYDLH